MSHYRYIEAIKIGLPIAELKRNTKLHNNAFRARIKKYMYHVINQSNGVCFGSKQSAYYENEDEYGVVPQYSWNELSKNEIEFYESKN